MLRLSRRPGESLIISGGIKITVIAAVGGNVSLGIDAPKAVVVDREEVHERKLRREPFKTVWGDVP